MIDQKTKEMLRHFHEGKDFYKKCQFKEAIECFKKALVVMPEDHPSKVFVERCEELIKSPPPKNWDGVYQMTRK